MATGKTWLELTNAVLTRLRESTVTTVAATTYTSLIGAFVNEVKREVEDAWDWNRLRTYIDVTTVVGTSSYTLPAVGKRFRVLDAFNRTQTSEMIQISMIEMDRLSFLGTPGNGAPIYYNFNGQSSGDPKINVYPIPNLIQTLRFNIVIPQDDLSADGTQLVVPDWPVVLGAWARSVSERGEDGGANSSEVDVIYHNALADAIAQDANLARDETIWDVV